MSYYEPEGNVHFVNIATPSAVGIATRSFGGPGNWDPLWFRVVMDLAVPTIDVLIDQAVVEMSGRKYLYPEALIETADVFVKVLDQGGKAFYRSIPDTVVKRFTDPLLSLPDTPYAGMVDDTNTGSHPIRISNIKLPAPGRQSDGTTITTDYYVRVTAARMEVLDIWSNSTPLSGRIILTAPIWSGLTDPRGTPNFDGRTFGNGWLQTLDLTAGLPGTPGGRTEAEVQAFTISVSNILRNADARLLTELGTKLALGETTAAQVNEEVIRAADATTTVATLAYQFFTGKIPSAGGYDFLVSPTGSNPNNLNSAYYQSFNLENRYINFAVNLGKIGEGRQKFEAAYGARSLFEATKAAYGVIFGATPSDAKVAALLAGGRDAYFATYGGDGLAGIGTKAAMVGWLMAESAKADIGMFSRASDAFLRDLADGANFAVDLVGVYGRPEFAYSGG